MDPASYATNVASFFEEFLPQASLIGEFTEWAQDASNTADVELNISFPDEQLEFALHHRGRLGTVLYDDRPDRALAIALVRDGSRWAVASVWVHDPHNKGLMAAARRAFGHSILQPEESENPSQDLAEWVLMNQNLTRRSVH